MSRRISILLFTVVLGSAATASGQADDALRIAILNDRSRIRAVLLESRSRELQTNIIAGAIVFGAAIIAGSIGAGFYLTRMKQPDDPEK